MPPAERASRPGSGRGASRAGLRSAAHRVGWGIADQAFSSLTNFAVGILVARTLGAADFGAFSFAFAAYLVVMSASRALGTEPLIIRYTGVAPDRWRLGTARAVGTAAAVGAAAGLVCVAVGVIADGAVGDAYLAVGLMLPGLMVQDAWRFAFFAAGRGRDAFLNDVAWAAVLFPAFAVLMATDAVSVLTATLVWGGAAGVAGLVGVAQARVAPRPLDVPAWWREHRDVAPSYLGEFLSLNGALQLSLFGVGAFGGLAAAGGYRAGQVLLGPLKVVFQGLQMVAVPEAVKVYRRSARGYVLACVVLSAVMAALALAFGAVVLLLPDATGRALLGSTWEPARAVTLPLAVATAAGGAITGAQTGLRVLAAARGSLRARLATSLLTVVLSVGGAALGGARLAAWGTALAGCVAAVLWWHTFLTELRVRGIDRSTGEAGPAAPTGPDSPAARPRPAR